MATRSTTTVAAAFACLLACVASPSAAEAQGGPGVAGRWEARWAPGIRTERDGSITVRREADAVLELDATGDSLTGTWTFEMPGTARSTWRVHGRLRDGRLALVATEHETETPPPPGQGEIVRQEWYGTSGADHIEGEHWMVLRLPDGREMRSGPRPWSAERRPAGTSLARPSPPRHPALTRNEEEGSCRSPRSSRCSQRAAASRTRWRTP